MSIPSSHYHDHERTYDSLHSILNNLTDNLSTQTPRPTTASAGGLMDILSAARYPDALQAPGNNVDSQTPPRHKRKAPPVIQHFGGIIVNGDPSDESKSSFVEPRTEAPTKRKRSTKQASAPDDQDDQHDTKRQRGRPRVDTKDQTAADRRRTQIRLAQRAYRHRKESTISSLKQKVAALQTTINTMNKTFLDLYDNLINANITSSHYGIEQQLQSATDVFASLSRMAATESDDEDEKLTGVSPDHALPTSNHSNGGFASSSQHETDPISSDLISTTLDASNSDVEAEFPLIVSTGAEHQSLMSTTALQSDLFDASAINDLSQIWQYNAQLDDLTPTFLNPTFSDKISMDRPWKSPAQPQGSYTYSFQETTFARRLQRLCLERAFRNLTNPDIDPAYIKRAFRFTFCFSNRKRMLERFQEMLKRRAGESLENWKVPFFHIGGAGTHFPRQDNDGNAIYPPNMVSPAKAFGPQPWIQVETPRSEATIQEMLDNIGFGGEWYDSHDVEEYLKTKGIFADGSSSFIEVDPNVLLLVKGSTGNNITPSTVSSSSSQSPHDALIKTPSSVVDDVSKALNEPFITKEMGDMFNYTSSSILAAQTLSHSSTPSSLSVVPTDQANGLMFADTLDSWSHPVEQLHFDMPMYGQFSRPGPVTFDVELFLEKMVESSACLGRAPGFRKDAVDEALRLSVQEAF